VIIVALITDPPTVVFAQASVILSTTPDSNAGGLDQFVSVIAIATILSGALFWFALGWRVRHPRQLAPVLTRQNEETAG
jgi:hypothetical protein